MSESLPSTAGYAGAAAELAARYERVRFEDVHGEVLFLFPTEPSDILDIGAGSGRDAAALAMRGHRVVAVEPTNALRCEAQRLHSDAAIEWIDDALPGLPVMRASARRFDLILLSAVWMHLDETQRPAAMSAVADLLRPGGTVVLSLRHGPVPEGRRMFDVGAEETARLGCSAGLAERYRGQRRDAQGRDDITWSVLALCRPPGGDGASCDSIRGK